MPSVKLMLLGAVPELYRLYTAEDGFPEAHRRTLILNHWSIINSEVDCRVRLVCGYMYVCTPYVWCIHILQRDAHSYAVNAAQR